MEIEIKAKVCNLANLRQKILSLGVKKVARKHQLDVYLSPPHKSFFNTRYYLRVRQDLLNKKGSSFEYLVVQGTGQHSTTKEMEVKIGDAR